MAGSLRSDKSADLHGGDTPETAISTRVSLRGIGRHLDPLHTRNTAPAFYPWRWAAAGMETQLCK